VLETKTRVLKPTKLTKPITPLAPAVPASYAQTASNSNSNRAPNYVNQPQTSQTFSSDPTVQNWTLVEPRNKANSNAKANSKPKSQEPTKRLILIKAELVDFSALRLRNTINKAFEEAGVKGPVVNTITKTLGNNLVITTTSVYLAVFLLEKQAIWQGLIRFQRL